MAARSLRCIGALSSAAQACREASSTRGFASLANLSKRSVLGASASQESALVGGASASCSNGRGFTAALVSPPPGALRAIHTSAPVQSTMLIGGLSVAAAAVAASYAVRAYNAANPPEGGEAPKEKLAGDKSASGSEQAEAKPAASSHKGFGAEMFAKRFYRGPFEDKMTKREASLILGVRESASPERIRDRHKKMLILNHPDIGGSTYLAGKINEAKDILLGRVR